MRNLDERLQKEAVEVFKDLIRYMGLGSVSSINSYAEANHLEPALNIALVFKAPMDIRDASTNMPFMKFFGKLREQVEKSELVQLATYKLEKELKETQGLLKARDAELEDLRQYKAHFDVEMQLRHGPEKEETDV